MTATGAPSETKKVAAGPVKRKVEDLTHRETESESEDEDEERIESAEEPKGDKNLTKGASAVPIAMKSVGFWTKTRIQCLTALRLLCKAHQAMDSDTTRWFSSEHIAQAVYMVHNHKITPRTARVNMAPLFRSNMLLKRDGRKCLLRICDATDYLMQFVKKADNQRKAFCCKLASRFAGSKKELLTLKRKPKSTKTRQQKNLETMEKNKKLRSDFIEREAAEATAPTPKLAVKKDQKKKVRNKAATSTSTSVDSGFEKFVAMQRKVYENFGIIKNMAAAVQVIADEAADLQQKVNRQDVAIKSLKEQLGLLDQNGRDSGTAVRKVSAFMEQIQKHGTSRTNKSSRNEDGGENGDDVSEDDSPYLTRGPSFALHAMVTESLGLCKEPMTLFFQFTMPLAEFNKQYLAFCKSNYEHPRKCPALTANYYMPIFRKHGIKIIRASRKWKGVWCDTVFLDGIGFNHMYTGTMETIKRHRIKQFNEQAKKDGRPCMLSEDDDEEDDEEDDILACYADHDGFIVPPAIPEKEEAQDNAVSSHSRQQQQQQNRLYLQRKPRQP